MNKENLLKLIAETGYNVGFGAKRNFATFDLVEKAPGWLSFISLAVGVYALFIPSLASTHVAAAMVLFGIATLYIGFYQQDKQKYEDAGKELTRCFHELRSLYYQVNSMPNESDFTSQLMSHQALCDRNLTISVSKQIFLSDWYAHFKFFWQQQIEWIDEQKKFRFWRDKVPLSFTASALLLAIMLVFTAYGYWLKFPCLAAP